MIIDKLTSLEKYVGVIPHAAAIAKFLRERDCTALPAGRYDLEATDGVFVNVCDITNGKNDIYEAHRRYSDLQCLLKGDEIMKRCHIDDAADGEDYNREGDCILFKSGRYETTVHLNEGEFALFCPEDAHAPGTAGDAPSVRKLIFKIPVKE